VSKVKNTEVEIHKLKIETKDLQEGDECLESYDSYGLRYHEFIGLMIKAMQEMSAKITTLENEIRSLKGK